VIGLRRADPWAVFGGIPMSTGVTFRHQEVRLRSLGFEVRHAATHRDIDTLADLLAVADVAPGTRTARLAASLRLRMEMSA
jgi:glycosyltransferase A (GT-A) superfamily protein (DUF2064 family)